ncbi:MAG: undecaprenyldiphospho-muramoylpentapeptide beta-N-acetylglucosaminyltransferase [Bacillota bacterium]|jgi:UDP-N-acetylglucosamine--N-acetylmuramyl-(pentapeptide) pyrophosphoryl-undecaprenol N-acetylglucosamine transferase
MNRLRVVITGGGTGGHIYPALAIAAGLFAKAEAQILYIGGRDSLESKLATQAGWDFRAIETSPLHRKSLVLLKDLAANKRGMKQAQKFLLDYQPHLAIGTGGYASWPVMKAALKLGIPTMIHEQNAVPGLSNKMLAKKVDIICLNFNCAKELFSARQRDKIYTTGLPIRPQIMHVDKQKARDLLKIKSSQPVFLVTGGSQGAQAINNAVAEAWLDLLGGGLQIIHISGAKNYDEVMRKAKAQGLDQSPQLRIIPYLEHMEYGLALADLVLGRAGASFLSEILCLGIPSILAPYPYAAANHQLLNAQAVEKAGGAIIIEDKDLHGKSVADAVLNLFADKERMLKMSACASGLGKPQALDNIIEIALKLIKT